MVRALFLLALLPWSGLSLSLGRTWARRGPLATGGRRAWSAPRHRVAARSEDGGGGRRATLKERIAQARAENAEKSAANGAGAGGGAGGGAEAPKGLLAMLQGEPKEPEPPAPNDVGLRRVSYHFQLMRMLTSNALLLSVFMRMIAERNADTMPRLVAASALYTSWLWRLVSCGYVYEVLHKATKRDELARPEIKLLNLAVIGTVLSLGVAHAPIAPALLYCAALPSVLALMRSGVGGLRALGGLGLSSPTPAPAPADAAPGTPGARWMALLYGAIAIGSLTAVVERPLSLPLLRAAVCYVLHCRARDDDADAAAGIARTTGPGDMTPALPRLATEESSRLNDALQYGCFTLFPTDFMQHPALSFAIALPMLCMYASSTGSSIGKEGRKAAREKAAANPAAAEAAAAAAAPPSPAADAGPGVGGGTVIEVEAVEDKDEKKK